MKKSSGLTGALGLLVFALLAMCLLGTLLSGATGYKRMVAAGEERFAEYTAARYLAVRVRQGESVSLEDFEGHPALALHETIEDLPFVTRVYERDGSLWELFSFAQAELHPQDGEKLLEARGLELAWEGSLLRMEVNGKTLYLYPRQGRQVGK